MSARVPGVSVHHRAERKARGKGGSQTTGATPYTSASIRWIPRSGRRSGVAIALIGCVVAFLINCYQTAPPPPSQQWQTPQVVNQYTERTTP